MQSAVGRRVRGGIGRRPAGGAGTYPADTNVDPAAVLPDSRRCFEATYPPIYPIHPSRLATSGGATIKCK